MAPLPLFLNILWVLFGVLWMAIAWLVAGVIMVITIIGIPWARAAFTMAGYAFPPFGAARCIRAMTILVLVLPACSVILYSWCSRAGGWRSVISASRSFKP